MLQEQEVKATWIDERTALWTCPECHFHQKSNSDDIVRVAPLNHGENYSTSRCMNCNIRVKFMD